MSGFKVKDDKVVVEESGSDSEEDNDFEGGSDSGSGSDSDGSGSGSGSDSDSGSDDDEDELEELEAAAEGRKPTAAPKKRKDRDDDEDGGDEEGVKFVKDDMEGIDVSNIITGGRRRSAMASGLATKPAVPSARAVDTASKASSSKDVPAATKAPANFKSKAIVCDDDDEEAEF